MTAITMQVADLIAAIDPAAEIRYRRALAAEAEQRGHERGVRDGYLQAVAEVKRMQHQLVDDLELELTRWHVCCGPCRRTGHRHACARCKARTRTAFCKAHTDDYRNVA
jgi:hypothetical protein